MTRRSHYWPWFAVLLAATAVSVPQESAPQQPPAAPVAFQQLAPGVEYRHEKRAAGPLSMHVLRVERRQHRWELHTGLGQCTVFGLEPLEGIVRSLSQNLRKPAIAAINGDFFVIRPGPYQGDPRGLQIVHRELVSSPIGNAFWVAPDGNLQLGQVTSRLRVLLSDGRTETPLGLNEQRPDDGLVLYTPTLGLRPGIAPPAPVGTRTQGGRELVLEPVNGQAWLPLEVGQTYPARVRQILDTGDTPLTPGNLILSIGPKTASTLPPIKLGDVLRLVMETQPNLQGVTTAIGGGRILLEHGQPPDVGPPTQPRHPRSLLGWNRESLWLVVIDGRQAGLSIGMTYPEMAALAKEYGCTEAIELDGGGSSTLWAAGRVLNSPSDGWPRAIANGLVLFRGD